MKYLIYFGNHSRKSNLNIADWPIGVYEIVYENSHVFDLKRKEKLFKKINFSKKHRQNWITVNKVSPLFYALLGQDFSQ